MRINAVGVSDAHVVGYGTGNALLDASLRLMDGFAYRLLARGKRLEAKGERLKTRDYELFASTIGNTIPAIGSH